MRPGDEHGRVVVMKTRHVPGSTVILRCSCAAPFEDDHYGAGMRVHNCMARGMSKGQRESGSAPATEARCAQCKTVRNIPVAA